MKVELGFAWSLKKFPFNIAALFIHVFQKINASHAYLAYYSETNNKKYLDATSSSVRDMLRFRFLRHYEIRKPFYCVLPIERKDFLAWAEKHEGKEYSFIQILGLSLKVLHITTLNVFRGDPTRMICNELSLDFCVEFLELKLEKNINDYDLDETLEIFTKLIEDGKLHRGEI